ncbi:MAG: hypothetical protein U0931_25345 [Vulcanimicrobiota bacterium]
MRTRRRGGALLLVLCCLPFLAMIALLMLNQATMNVTVIDRFWNSQKAQELARSAVVTAYVEILSKRTYGVDQNAEVKVTMPELGDPQAYGLVTFHRDSGLPYSVNNYQGESSVQCYDATVVPRDSICLVGTGTYRGVTRRWMTFLKAPPFDRALSSSGAIRSTGGLLLGAMSSTDALRDGELSPDELKPSRLVSNGKDSGGVEALKIEGEAEIHGELKSAGSIAIPTTIKGNPLQFPNSQPEEMPTIKVRDYDPESRPSLQRLSKDSYDSEKTFSGFAKYSGAQVTFEKGVKLDHGVLYVDGDLVINGPVQGDGAIFCTGKVIMRGGADLTSDNHAAVVAEGDVRILGSGSQRSYFTGLIYSGGQGGFPGEDVDQDLVVRNVTVQGCVVNAGKGRAGDGSAMQVDNARILFEQQGSQVILEPGFSGTWPIPVGGGVRGNSNGSLALRPVTVNGKTFTPGPAYFARRGTPLTAGDFVFTDDTGHSFGVEADGTVPDELKDAFRNTIAQAAASSWQAEIDEAKQDTAGQGVFKLDLNEFLQQEGRLKVVMRRLD